MRTFRKASAPPSARTLGRPWYVDPAVFERERQHIFGREWICAARTSQLAQPGDFVTVAVAGESLILTRDKSAMLHAFYNVCRHRGTRLCTQAHGRLTSIQCPYHAWTYALDGRLTAARNMDDSPGFRMDEYPLREAHIAEQDGFVFVSLDPRLPFDQFIAPLRSRLTTWGLSGLALGKSIEYEVACNWKLIFQNYSECYHCPVIHPQLERLSASDSGRNDLTEGAILGGYSTLRDPQASLTNSGRTARAALAGVRGEERERVYYYTLFPSLLLSLHPDYAMAHFVQPRAVDRTAVRCEWYFDANAARAQNFDCSDAVDFWDVTNRQDWAVSGLTQLGVGSRAYTPGPYSQQEGLLHAFDRHYLGLMDVP